MRDGDLGKLRVSMKGRFDDSEYEAVWARRLGLGYSLAQEGASIETWFWVNALPALSALRSVTAMAEINERLFSSRA